MSAETTHPTDEQLRGFAAGTLSEEEWDSIERHLAICVDCSRRSGGAAKTDDKFVAALKDAHHQSSESEASTHSRQHSVEDTQGWSSGKSEVLADGTSFGRYTLQGVLGKGAFATVYRAVDRKLDREVAVKVLRGSATAHDIRRFLREARAAGRLNHRNICPIYDMGQHDGVRFIVMALVKGQTLREYLDSGKRVTPKQAVTTVYKLASALRLAHSQGIVHRDLKPANIMIDARQKNVVILDFGLARRMDPKGSRITHAGDLLGTPVYMAPEQVQGAVKTVGPRTDVYALGVILYELLAGRRPFAGSVAEVFAQVLYEPPAAPSTYAKGLDPALDVICLKALAKDVNDRFQSMQEFRDALVDFSKGNSAASPQDSNRLSSDAKVDWSQPQREVTRAPVEDGASSLALAPPDSVLLSKTTCPQCGEKMPPRSQLCDACGYHQGLRQTLEAFSQQSGSTDFAKERRYGGNPNRLVSSIAVVVAVLVISVVVWASTVHYWWVALGIVLLGAVAALIVAAATWRKAPGTTRLYLHRILNWRQIWPPRFRKVLDMRGTRTTDTDLQSIQEDWNVEVLDLEDARVTDAGVDSLSQIVSLRFLVLRGTEVTPAGVNELKKRMPKTRIWANSKTMAGPSIGGQLPPWKTIILAAGCVWGLCGMVRAVQSGILRPGSVGTVNVRSDPELFWALVVLSAAILVGVLIFCARHILRIVFEIRSD